MTLACIPPYRRHPFIAGKKRTTHIIHNRNTITITIIFIFTIISNTIVFRDDIGSSYKHGRIEDSISISISIFIIYFFFGCCRTRTRTVIRFDYFFCTFHDLLGPGGWIVIVFVFTDWNVYGLVSVHFRASMKPSHSHSYLTFAYFYFFLIIIIINFLIVILIVLVKSNDLTGCIRTFERIPWSLLVHSKALVR